MTHAVKIIDMKKVTFYLIPLFTLIFISSCTKEKPPVGNYIGEFTYENSTNFADKTIWLKIVETEKDYILIGKTDYNGNLTSAWLDTLYKKGEKDIEGNIPALSNGTTYIKGKWSHKLFSKKYAIKGDFTETYYTQGGSNEQQVKGTFEIKSF
jgi:hypothetical protein